MRFVLDTNIVSALLNENQMALTKFNALGDADHLILCPVVYFESRQATAQLQRFGQLIASQTYQDYTHTDWQLAAQLWTARRAAGRPIADADLLIAVFARNRDAVVVTDNTKDFDDLGVSVENWLTA